MAEIDYIRQEVNARGSSYNASIKKIERDPGTIKKYVQMEDFSPQEKLQHIKYAKVMDPVKSILDKWIQEDVQKRKKFFRTAKRMYDLLVEEYNFTGSNCSVRQYVSHQKKKLIEKAESVTLLLEAKAEIAQVDFQETSFQYESKMITLSYLVMSFLYSNAFYF